MERPHALSHLTRVDIGPSAAFSRPRRPLGPAVLGRPLTQPVPRNPRTSFPRPCRRPLPPIRRRHAGPSDRPACPPKSAAIINDGGAAATLPPPPPSPPLLSLVVPRDPRDPRDPPVGMCIPCTCCTHNPPRSAAASASSSSSSTEVGRQRSLADEGRALAAEEEEGVPRECRGCAPRRRCAWKNPPNPPNPPPATLAFAGFARFASPPSSSADSAAVFAIANPPTYSFGGGLLTRLLAMKVRGALPLPASLLLPTSLFLPTSLSLPASCSSRIPRARSAALVSAPLLCMSA